MSPRHYRTLCESGWNWIWAKCRYRAIFFIVIGFLRVTCEISWLAHLYNSICLLGEHAYFGKSGCADRNSMADP